MTNLYLHKMTNPQLQKMMNQYLHKMTIQWALLRVPCRKHRWGSHFKETTAFAKDTQCEVLKMGNFRHLGEMIGHLW